MHERRRFLSAAAACAAGLILPASARADGAGKIALVVGNAAYAGQDRLRNPVADATLTARSLRGLGFRVTLLTDRSLAQLQTDLAEFARQAAGADIALFFYAGHGVAVENINYLVAVDQTLASLSSLDLKRRGVSLRWVESLLAQSRAAVSVLVVDACRNALMRSAARQGMAPAAPARGMLTFFSTAPGALARDGSGQNSEFSEAFNRHLAQPGLTLKQLIELTQHDVSAATGATQIPWVSSGLVGDVRLASAQQLAQAGPAQGAPAGSGKRGGEAPPGRFWNENLARLEEQIGLDLMRFDINSLPVFEQRAAAGDVMALTTLGALHARADSNGMHLARVPQGVGATPVHRDNGVIRPDPARALGYLKKAADQGFPIAQTMLAELLVEAPRGVPRDYQKAANLLEAAAATGYGRARLDLLDLKVRRGAAGPEDLLENAKTLEQYIRQFAPPR